MKYHRHHQGRYDDDDEAERRRYQPPSPQPEYQPYITPSAYPPPPHAELSLNLVGLTAARVTLSVTLNSNYPGSNAEHVSIERGYAPDYGHHSHGHHHAGGGSSAHAPAPPLVTQTQHYNEGNKSLAELMKKLTVRIYTKAGDNYSLTIRDGKVVLVRADERDPYQHWIKDMKYSTKIKDEEGYPAFALVNKATGEAIKHSFGAKQEVRLVKYNPDYLDESVLWTESKDLGDGFRCIRMVNNIYLNFDAFNGDKEHGGVRDGTVIQTWEWLTGDNQRWKIVP